jgi:hypothetical protein
MAGSPTLLIDGTDPFTTPGQSVPAVACRIYRQHDQPSPAPSVAQLRVALTAAGVAATSMQPATAPESPADVLGAWRARAVPVDPVEKAVHQLILRTFTSSGRAPTVPELAAVRDGSGRASAKVLEACMNSTPSERSGMWRRPVAVRIVSPGPRSPGAAVAALSSVGCGAALMPAPAERAGEQDCHRGDSSGDQQRG